MGIKIKPSDLYFRYPKKRIGGVKPEVDFAIDGNYFDRDNLDEVIPMFEAIMDALGTQDGEILQMAEEILNERIPRFVDTREAVFHCIIETLEAVFGRTRQ